MAKGYRPVLRDQPFLLPVDMREWLPADHLVWFVLDVVERVDTAAFHRRRRRLKAVSGRAAYRPEMLLALLPLLTDEWVLSLSEQLPTVVGDATAA